MKVRKRVIWPLLIALVMSLIVWRILTSVSADDIFDKDEWNRMMLGTHWSDARENLKRGGQFESNSFEGKDAYGTPVRFEKVGAEFQIRSAGPDKNFNTDDDYIKKEEEF